MMYDMNPPQNVTEDWTYTPIVSLFLVHTEMQYLFVQQYWTVLLPLVFLYGSIWTGKQLLCCRLPWGLAVVSQEIAVTETLLSNIYIYK